MQIKPICLPTVYLTCKIQTYRMIHKRIIKTSAADLSHYIISLFQSYTPSDQAKMLRYYNQGNI